MLMFISLLSVYKLYFCTLNLKAFFKAKILYLFLL